MPHLLSICLFLCFDDPEPRDEWHTRKIWVSWEELSLVSPCQEYRLTTDSTEELVWAILRFP